MSKQQQTAIKFDSFIFQANIFYKSVGVEPYVKGDGKRNSYLLDIIFFISVFNMNFVLVSELIFVFLAMKNQNNFIEATMNLTYIGFVFTGDIKILSIWYKKSKLTQLMHNLRVLYPKTVALQKVYHTERFLRNYNLISFGFVIVNIILIWTYNLFIAVSYLIYDYWLHVRTVEHELPYHCWVPWDWHDNWSYYMMYASQNLAGHTCMAGQVANDLLLCVVANQLIMHYRYLANKIESHVAVGDYNDLNFLNSIIIYHQKIYHLLEAMNDVFGVSLIVNFLSSSLVICFLGFQLTIGVQTDTLVMLMFFLFCSLVQIYMVCNYGQELILSSESIGHAVYRHNWQNANQRYKKMMILIIKRAQKPAILKATTFLHISLGTMTDLIQLSYKFFALIRTMYSK